MSISNEDGIPRNQTVKTRRDAVPEPLSARKCHKRAFDRESGMMEVCIGPWNADSSANAAALLADSLRSERPDHMIWICWGLICCKAQGSPGQVVSGSAPTNARGRGKRSDRAGVRSAVKRLLFPSRRQGKGASKPWVSGRARVPELVDLGAVCAAAVRFGPPLQPRFPLRSTTQQAKSKAQGHRQL